MRFAALVVVGDGKGKVGYGLGKAGEVPQAIEKAQQAANNRMIDVAIVGTTIPHETIGKYGRGYVILLPATSGTGVIAGGAVRSVLEAAGIKDIATKAYGTTNPRAQEFKDDRAGGRAQRQDGGRVERLRGAE